MESENDSIKIMFDQWYQGIRSAQAVHSVAAIHYLKLHRLVGFLVVGLTSSVGVLTFYTPSGEHSSMFDLIKSILSVLAVVMASVQTFFNYSDLSQRHGCFSTKYRILRKELDQFFLEGGLTKSDTNFMDSFRKRWDSIDQDAPIMSERFIKKANTVMKQQSGIKPFTQVIQENN